MNRQQRRRSAHVSKRSKDPAAKQLSVRARFEQDLRTALDLEAIKLIRADPGQEQDASTGKPTGETYWVFTVYAEKRFLTVKSARGTLADVVSGVTRAVRETIQKRDHPEASAITHTVSLEPSIIKESTPRAPDEIQPADVRPPDVLPIQLDENGDSGLGQVARGFGMRGVTFEPPAELSLAERIRQAGGT